jgi:hypothetical protein
MKTHAYSMSRQTPFRPVGKPFPVGFMRRAGGFRAELPRAGRNEGHGRVSVKSGFLRQAIGDFNLTRHCACGSITHPNNACSP